MHGSRDHCDPAQDADGAGGRRVLVLSASMGAGHDGAARELARRMEAAGHHAEVRDFLDAGPLHIGAVLRGGYEFELRHVPGAYDASYRFWYRYPWLCPAIAWLTCILTRRRVLRWVRRSRADVVVSTYPLATLCLGRLRRLGRLRVPAVNFVTDFGVHPLWVHRGIDLNLAVHEGPARMAATRTGRPSVACGPQVSGSFDLDDAERDRLRREQRADLALRPGDAAVLVVAGSWGVGAIEETIEAVTAGGFVPVVVCGRDAALETRVRRRVARSGWRAVVIGWTDRMPALMAACDALVENAGGLTSFEAMRAGLPVVSYNPIAGHGVDNTGAMDAAGVSTLAADGFGLTAALGALTAPGPRRDTQVATARAVFAADAVDAVLTARRLDPSRPRVATAVAARAATLVATAAAAAWLGLTSGVGVAAAEGLGVADPPAGAGQVAYLGVRLDAAELADPAVIAGVEALRASVVVDGPTAAADPSALRSLTAAGVGVVDGGAGHRYGPGGDLEHPAPWNRAEDDVTAAGEVSHAAGVPVTLFAPGRSVTAWDLYDCASDHLTAVVASAVIHVPDDRGDAAPLPALHAGGTYLVIGTGSTPTATVALLAELASGVHHDDLTVAPLAALHG